MCHNRWKSQIYTVLNNLEGCGKIQETQKYVSWISWKFQRKWLTYIPILQNQRVCKSRSKRLRLNGDESLNGQDRPNDAWLVPEKDHTSNIDEEKTLKATAFVVITIIRGGQFFDSWFIISRTRGACKNCGKNMKESMSREDYHQRSGSTKNTLRVCPILKIPIVENEIVILSANKAYINFGKLMDVEQPTEHPSPKIQSVVKKMHLQFVKYWQESKYEKQEVERDHHRQSILQKPTQLRHGKGMNQNTLKNLLTKERDHNPIKTEGRDQFSSTAGWKDWPGDNMEQKQREKIPGWSK